MGTCVSDKPLKYAGSTNHWVCVYGDGSGVVKVMDSLAAFMPLSSMTIQAIAKIHSIPSDHSVLKLKTLPVQQQDVYLDCGLFAVAYSIEVCCKNISGFGGMTFDQKKNEGSLA